MKDKTLFPYIGALENCNPSLQGSQCYILYPGMEFGSQEKWWPDRGQRPTLHEGIDLCYYIAENTTECAFTPSLKVPVMASGRVRAICRDFLGSSLFLDHEYDQSRRFLSIYAHIVPEQHLEAGQRLNAGDVIGTIADTAGRKNRMAAHLHLSMLQVERSVSPEQLNWDFISGPARSALLDPLEMFAAEKIQFRTSNPWKKAAMRY